MADSILARGKGPGERESLELYIYMYIKLGWVSFLSEAADPSKREREMDELERGWMRGVVVVVGHTENGGPN